ncbi:hypothetical protein LPY66_18255 [Dehalobacter sp. DCM]|uniref:hypothetical protein n=1 Tax=Dehalobacter sp. DCM TaxID=2907827 RepID=UPI0030818F6C|nr:hypothetical protein LPY66_18255 [Dehalobacter sp. DCM]
MSESKISIIKSIQGHKFSYIKDYLGYAPTNSQLQKMTMDELLKLREEVIKRGGCRG